MVRFGAAVFCVVSAGCFGQVREPDRQLATGEPRDTAWAAYTIGVQGRSEMVPKLAELVGRFDGGGATADQGRISPEAAAMEAVADALIRLEARLPADVVMHLYPRFPAQTIILLSRASDNSGALMEIFEKTKSRVLWLAAGNLLAAHPPPGFVRALLGGLVTSFSFRVVWTDPEAGFGFGGGCGCGGGLGPNDDFRDWPKARMYRIVQDKNVPGIFAPGIHPVGFSWSETTDYRDLWDSGNCWDSTNVYWGTGLIAQLLGKKMSELPLQPEFHEVVVFTSAWAFEERVRSAIEEKSRALREVAGAFVESGELTAEDAAALHLQCTVNIVDERPLPRADLQASAGRWCATVP